MKIAINALVIDKKKAGIGRYGYNLINHIKRIIPSDCCIFAQSSIGIDGKNIVRTKSFRSNYSRILMEQISMPRYYRNYDLVHFIDYASPIIPIKTPFITTIHDLSFFKFPETFSLGSRTIKEIIAPISISRASIIVAVSQNTKNDIIDLFPSVANKIRVVYQGINSFANAECNNSIDKIKLKFGITSNYILAVGTIEPRKNLKRVIEAFDIMQSYNTDIQLVIVGKLGWLYDEILEKANRLVSLKKLIFTNYVPDEDLPSLYSGAECLIYPSLYEGFGLPPLEAMSCGTPVVVSNTSSLPEVVGDAGFYVDPLDSESIANGMLRILNDSQLSKQLVEKGYRQISKYSWDKAASQIIDIYKEILD